VGGEIPLPNIISDSQTLPTFSSVEARFCPLREQVPSIRASPMPQSQQMIGLDGAKPAHAICNCHFHVPLTGSEETSATL